MAKNPMSCGSQCSRVAVITLNVIFLICGLALFVLGLVFRFGGQELKDDIKPVFEGIEINNYDFYTLINSLAILFIVIGAIIIVFAMLGFVGAVCLVRWALIAYAILIGLCLALELAGIILFFIMNNKFEEAVKDGLKKVIEKANGDPTDTGVQDSKKGVEYMFDKFECCHVGGKRLNSGAFTMNECAVASSRYLVDCYDAFTDWLSGYQFAFIGIGIAVMVIQVLLIIISCWLCRVSKKEELV